MLLENDEFNHFTIILTKIDITAKEQETFKLQYTK